MRWRRVGAYYAIGIMHPKRGLPCAHVFTLSWSPPRPCAFPRRPRWRSNVRRRCRRRAPRSPRRCRCSRPTTGGTPTSQRRPSIRTRRATSRSWENNGGTRRLHPDFGGEASAGSVDVYGMPYAVVDGTQPKQAVTFDYWDESDGVDATGRGLPFYPIPAQAITQPHWVEGGAPANVDQRSQGDRHLLIKVDCANEVSLRALQRLLQRDAGEVVRGLRRVLRHERERAPSRRLDLRRRRGPRHLSGTRPLRRGMESARSPTSATRFG